MTANRNTGAVDIHCPNVIVLPSLAEIGFFECACIHSESPKVLHCTQCNPNIAPGFVMLYIGSQY